MVNHYTKFEVSSLSRSRDILGGLKILMSHVTWPRPFQGQYCVVHRLGLAMINLYTMFTLYEDIKGNAKCRNLSDLEG